MYVLIKHSVDARADAAGQFGGWASSGTSSTPDKAVVPRVTGGGGFR